MEKKVVSPAAQEKQPLQQLIVFRVGDEEFGIPIETIQEIIKVGVITPIPDSPAFIRGLINVRGDIVAVINLKARFSLSADENPAKHIVITKQADSIFGVMVDEVIEILRVQEMDIKTPPHLMSKIHEDYVRGVLTHQGRLIILLDLGKVLSEDELIRLAETAHLPLRKRKEGDNDEIMDERILAQSFQATNQKTKKAREKKRKDIP